MNDFITAFWQITILVAIVTYGVVRLHDLVYGTEEGHR
jgi:hypothetical protein